MLIPALESGVHRMSRPLKILLAAALASLGVHHGIASSEPLDLSNAWFEPSLTASHDPVCAEMLVHTKAKFLSRKPWIEYAGNRTGNVLGIEGIGQTSVLEPLDLDDFAIESAGQADQDTQSSAAQPRDNSVVVPGGMRLYMRLLSSWSCGGACESQRLVVSEQALPSSLPDASTPELPFAASPSSNLWSLYRDARAGYFAVGIVDRRLRVYRITQPRAWALSCEIELEPTDVRASADPAVQEAVRAIEELESAVAGLARGAGSCGSLRTASRWASDVHESLTQVLFRPWATREPAPAGSKSENSYGDYQRNFEHLRDWSLTGIAEHRAFAAYNTQLAASIRQLAGFYRDKYRWSEAESQRMAQGALHAAISSGFGFYLYEPFAEQTRKELARAVLERRPLSQIRSIPLVMAPAGSPGEEPLLSAAVTYPEALRYLLERGADPNQANAFGKTPLMYAAQYNQQAAVAILLEYRADPNATTTLPADNCYYTLTTSNMTALHYAVRYGSAPLARLLVEHGAAAFARTLQYGEPGEYPLDWLRRYAGASADEPNINLSDQDVKELEALLQVPDEAERSRIATKLTQFAQSEYVAGRPQSAYQALRTALAAQDDNQQALEDLPLIALRAGHLGASLEAADALIAAGFSRSSTARAWFNKGLACERHLAGGRAFLEYNGRYYCQQSRLHPFLVSWTLEATVARKNKLVDIFEGGSMPTCLIAAAQTKVHFAFADDDADDRQGPRQMIYVYHPSTQKIAADSVHWSVSYYNAARKQTELAGRYPALLGSYDLGGSTISVLASPEAVQWPVVVGTEKCTAPPDRQQQ